ncbi:MAG: SDR family oxidoreductase, partial [Tepidisphaeraceae bacterium]
MGSRVLLTGATGAIGPHVAGELLAGEVDGLDVLIRAGTGLASSPRERFGRWREMVARVAPRVEPDRMQAVTGDLTLDGLGLDQADTDRLANETEYIVHAAADTQFRTAAPVQREVNVDGTRRMIELARRCRRLRRFILVSTTCVAGARTGVIEETAPADAAPVFVNGYERTKWEAERLALASGLPVRVVRLSVVTGSERDGFVHRPGALHHVLRWFGRGLVPVIPAGPGASVDLISSETAARCLACFALTDVEGPRVVHVAAGARAAPLVELVGVAMGSLGMSRADAPRLVDRAAFDAWCAGDADTTDPGVRIARQVAESIDTFLPGLLYPKTFATKGAEA